MPSFARAAALGVASTLLVIAALCVMDASLSSRFEDVAESKIPKDLRGNGLLRAQAKALDDERHFENRGKDMRSVDEMLAGFQQPSQDSYSSLTDDLKKQAPKKDDLEVALSGAMPDAAGIIHLDQKKDPLSVELNFVQVEDWSPSGQEGLSDAISDAKSADEEEALKQDQLKGRGVLSAVGLASEEDESEPDPFEGTMFVQEDATWEPQGQKGFSAAVDKARAEDEEDEAKLAGLHGDGLLSAVGIGSSAEDTIDDFADNELGLVQVDASEWVPQGQTGMAQSIQDAEAEDETAAVKEDGLKGTSLLGAAGLSQESEETQFVQDSVSNWTPKGVEHPEEDESELENNYKHDKALHEDGLEGESVLSAIGMGDHMKAADEMSDLGTIKEDEFDLDLD
jgi:hypothetical protein